MRRLVCEYYDGFSFGRFVKQYPHFKGHLTDLLIGDLFKDEVDRGGRADERDPGGDEVLTNPKRKRGVSPQPSLALRAKRTHQAH